MSSIQMLIRGTPFALQRRLDHRDLKTRPPQILFPLQLKNHRTTRLLYGNMVATSAENQHVAFQSLPELFQRSATLWTSCPKSQRPRVLNLVPDLDLPWHHRQKASLPCALKAVVTAEITQTRRIHRPPKSLFLESIPCYSTMPVRALEPVSVLNRGRGGHHLYFDRLIKSRPAHGYAAGFGLRASRGDFPSARKLMRTPQLLLTTRKLLRTPQLLLTTVLCSSQTTCFTFEGVGQRAAGSGPQGGSMRSGSRVRIQDIFSFLGIWEGGKKGRRWRFFWARQRLPCSSLLRRQLRAQRNSLSCSEEYTLACNHQLHTRLEAVGLLYANWVFSQANRERSPLHATSTAQRSMGFYRKQETVIALFFLAENRTGGDFFAWKGLPC
jgi:hypothetical protein